MFPFAFNNEDYNMKTANKALIIMFLFLLVLLSSKQIPKMLQNEHMNLISDDITENSTNIDFTDVTNSSELEIIVETESSIGTSDEEIITTTNLIDLEGLTTDFSNLERVYSFNENDYDATIQDMITIFFYSVLDDLKNEYKDMSFQILDYKNLTVYFSKVVPGVGSQSYEPKNSDTYLEFSADVEVRYKGYISPVLYFEKGSDEFFLITLSDWVLIKEQSTYLLYPYGYYYKTHK